jgi:hypothetical protein
VWWLTPVILAQKVEIGWIAIWSQPQQNVCQTVSQPVKAWSGDMCLSPQLCRKCKIKFQSINVRHKHETCLKNKYRQKGWECGSCGRCLPKKQKILCANSSTSKKFLERKEETKRRAWTLLKNLDILKIQRRFNSRTSDKQQQRTRSKENVKAKNS